MIQILVVLVVVGVVLWLINTHIPMQPPFKTIINVVAVLILCLWLLSVFGIIGSSNVPKLGRGFNAQDSIYLNAAYLS